MENKHLTCEIIIESRRNISVKVTQLEEKPFSLIEKYLNKNLETAIEQLITQMINDEITASATAIGKKREKMLKQINNLTAKQTRKRVVDSESFLLPRELKQQRRLLSEDFFSERGKFAKKFMSAYRKTIKNNELPNRTNIAKYLFPENENKLQCLRRELEKFYEDFDEILFAITHREEIQAAIDTE